MWKEGRHMPVSKIMVPHGELRGIEMPLGVKGTMYTMNVEAIPKFEYDGNIKYCPIYTTINVNHVTEKENNYNTIQTSICDI